MRCRIDGCGHRIRSPNAWFWKNWHICNCCSREVMEMNPALSRKIGPRPRVCIFSL